MRSLQLVKHDIISFCKSYLTYIALLLIWAMLGLMTILMAQHNDKVDYSTILPMANWMFLFFGLLVVIKTITRDYSQGTIQLYMNKVKNRIGYVVAKTISIVIISFIFTLITYVTMLIIQAFTDGKNLDGDKFLNNIWFYLIFLLFFGLLLFLITLIVQKPAVIFTLGIFLVFIVPFVQPFIGFIPEWGDNIQKSLKYIPFSYLTEKSNSGNIKFSNWQWFISIASIVVFFIANVIYAAKRDI
ncbi:ABC transporter permease subunit [Staphylococcus sp. NRL 16/872]|uniref:phenol-soluble modulin export ABC transporter permease subunit PmtD n=1 Tax=Staphylococcus sp. NRL 16/872 TaxID=2930131 RepID=UPI001FB50CA6|nr:MULTISPECIES: ABC transporter permease subunit [unclassified Staphylococcus]MCJ1655983.1 ABC transporter permease subunit [Staphylococcus sp. NRL 21/187]MCJ1661776.1 ABC transporter permease subunit [Staphylococcus sp. NRL 18/288]MCJ1667719.1 ABC transporter permease subunit [Staphylococcus sp. NRL 19/737]WEN70209.1 ABC transporter permease subunit [Staphylococcus sp. NRL 16/872]